VDKNLLIAIPDEDNVGNVLVYSVKGEIDEPISYRVTNGYAIDSLLLSTHAGRVALVISYYSGMYLRVFFLGKDSKA